MAALLYVLTCNLSHAKYAEAATQNSTFMSTVHWSLNMHLALLHELNYLYALSRKGLIRKHTMLISCMSHVIACMSVNCEVARVSRCSKLRGSTYCMHHQ